MKNNLNLLGALGAGIAASACCTIPLVLVSAGVGGSIIGAFTAMEPFRPLFVAIALVAIYVVVHREIKRSRQVDCDCDDQWLSDRARRVLIGAGVIVTLGLVASPWLIRPVLDSANAATPAPDFTGEQQVTLTVSGMTCDLCDITVQRALLGLDGVLAAEVTFTPPQAVVTYNPALVSVDDMERITREIGYPATPVVPAALVEKATYSIESPFCSGCVDGLVAAAMSIGGVQEATVDIEKQTLHILFDSDVIAHQALTGELQEKSALELVPDDHV